jgi:outer membrane protein assembly factor BamD (BamD/ComL family)
MSLVKLLMIFVGIAIVLGLIAAFTGVLKMDKEGNVSFDQKELDKQTTTSEMTKANLLAGQTKYDEAIVLYKAYLAKTPNGADAPEATFRLAKCYEDKGELPMAVKTYKEYITNFPKDSEDRRNRANTRISFHENAGVKAAK